MADEYLFTPKTPTDAEREELLAALREVWAMVEARVPLLDQFKPLGAVFHLWTAKGREDIPLAFDGTQATKRKEMERMRSLVERRGPAVLRAAFSGGAEVKEKVGALFLTADAPGDTSWEGVHVQVETARGCALHATATIRKPVGYGRYLDPPQTQIFTADDMVSGVLAGLFRKNATPQRAH